MHPDKKKKLERAFIALFLLIFVAGAASMAHPVLGGIVFLVMIGIIRWMNIQ